MHIIIFMLLFVVAFTFGGRISSDMIDWVNDRIERWNYSNGSFQIELTRLESDRRMYNLLYGLNFCEDVMDGKVYLSTHNYGRPYTWRPELK